MGTRAEYLRSLKQMRDVRNQGGNSIISPMDNNVLDATDMTSFANMNTPIVPTSTYSQPSDWKRTHDLLSARSFNANVTSGLFEAVDSVVDTAAVVGGWFAGLFNGIGTLIKEGSFEKGWNDVQESVQDFTTYDWAAHAEATLQQLDPRSLLTGEVFTKEHWDKWGDIGDVKKAREMVELQKKSSWAQDLEIVGQVEQGIGEILPTVGLAVATSGASLGTQATSTGLSLGARTVATKGLPMVGQIALQGGLAGTQALGRGFEEASMEGANYGGALGYGATKGVVSGAYNALTFGIGANIASKGGTGVVGKISNKAGDAILKKTGSKTAQVVTSKIVNIAIDSASEGLEEFTETLTDPVLKQITYDGDALAKAYGNDEAVNQTLANAGVAAGVAFLTSAIVQGTREGGEAVIDIKNQKEIDTAIAKAKKLQQDITDINNDLQTGKITKEEAKTKIYELNEPIEDIEETSITLANYFEKTRKSSQDIDNGKVYNADGDVKDIDLKQVDYDKTNIYTKDVKTYFNSEAKMRQENVDVDLKTDTDTDVDIDTNEDVDVKKETNVKAEPTKEELDYIDYVEKELPNDLVKDSANIKQDKVYSERTANHILDNVKTNIRNKFKVEGMNIKFGKDRKTKSKTFKALNLVKDKAKVADIIYDEFKNSTIEYKGSKVSFEALDPEIQADVKKAIQGLINSKGNKSMRLEFEAEIKRLNGRIEKEITRHWKDLETLSHTYKSVKAIKNKFVDPKQISIGGDVDVPQLNIFKRAVNSIRASVRAKGVSPKSVSNFVREFDNYKPENLTDSYLEYNPELRQTIDELKLSKYFDEKGEYKNMKVDPEDLELMNHALDLINAQMKFLKSEKYKQLVQIAKDNYDASEFVYSVYGKTAIGGGTFSQLKDGAMNIPTYFAQYLGKNHPLTKHFTEDYVKNMGNRENVRAEHRKTFLETIPKELGVKPNQIEFQLRKKIKLRDHRIRQSELLDLYELSKTAPDIYKNGFTIYDEKAKKPITLKLDEKEFKAEIIDRIPKVLKDFGDKVYTDYYNKQAKTYISGVYKAKHNGLEMDIVADYYPTRRAGENNLGLESGDIDAMGFITENIGAIKKRIKNSNPYEVLPFEGRFDSYVNAITRYGEMGDWIEKTRIMFNKKVGEHNANYFLKQILPNFDGQKGWNAYLTKVVLERPIGETATTLGKQIEKIYSNSVSSILGANPGTMLRQFLSLPQLLNADDVTVKNFMKALLTGGKNLVKWGEVSAEIQQYAPYFIKRWDTYESARSNINANKLNKIGQVFSKGMEFTDKSVILTVGWDLALNTASKALGLPKTDVDVKKLAGDYLTMATLTTQSNSDPMFMSRLRSGDLNKIAKYTFGLFGSDGENLLQHLNKVTFEFRNARKRIKWLENQLKDTDLPLIKREYYEKQLELENSTYSVKKEIQAVGKLSTSLVFTALGAALIGELMDRFKGKKDWEDELDGKELGKQILLEGFVNWIPYVGTIANALENNSDVSVFTVDRLNNLIDVGKQLVHIFETGDPRDMRRVGFELLFTTGELFGVPLKNIFTTSLGFVRIGDKFAGTNYADIANNWVKAFSPSYMKSRITSDVANNQINKAIADLSAWQFLYSIPQSEKVNKTLINLKKEGYDVLPKANLTAYKDEKGVVHTLSDNEQKQFFEFYKQATKEIDKVFEEPTFQLLDNETKAKTIRKFYDTYYDYAKGNILRKRPKARLGKLMSMTKGNLNLAKILPGLAKLGNVQPTKNQNHKEAVFEFIKSLKGYTKNEKLLLLWLSNYKINNSDSLVSYLRKLGVSYKDLIELELVKK